MAIGRSRTRRDDEQINIRNVHNTFIGEREFVLRGPRCVSFTTSAWLCKYIFVHAHVRAAVCGNGRALRLCSASSAYLHSPRARLHLFSGNARCPGRTSVFTRPRRLYVGKIIAALSPFVFELLFLLGRARWNYCHYSRPVFFRAARVIPFGRRSIQRRDNFGKSQTGCTRGNHSTIE